MISGGNDSVVKVAGAARRPSIRPKAVTPPRTASPDPLRTPTWTLPPVRTPAPRIAKRPILELVDQDDSESELVAPPPSSLVLAPWWKQPRTIALVAASVLAAAFTTAAVVWTASARRDAAEAIEAVGTTTLASASLTLSAPPASPVLAPPAQVAPAIPVVDVNSLPSVPGRVASGSAR